MSMIVMKDFKGLWPAMFTPVDQNGKPALGQLEKLTALLVQQRVDGLYLLGSTGLGVLFSEKERKEITEVVMRVVDKQIPVMVQVGAMTTAESIRLAQHAAQAGVDGISSVGPIYFSSGADGALNHYQHIASASTLPFYPYQLGDNSIPGKKTDFIKKLLEIPTVQGMKLTTSNLLEISAVHNYAGDRLRLFSGADELFCHAVLCGCVGAIGTTYNFWGKECKYVRYEFSNGNFQLAKDFMLALQYAIELILPNAWTFFRQAMVLKYQIDIGNAIHPVGNTNRKWEDAEVMRILESVEAKAGI
jgi:N-acetylneuraminate lyase